ncbi:hypothetical protein BH18ACT4_BH18ACT4_02560 [soil metagenome]
MTRPLDPTGLKRLHREWRRRTAGRVALLLDSVQNPYNVGSILRLAAAYRVEHLWLAGSTAAPGHKGVAKTALGSERFLSWTVVATPGEGAEQARAKGFTLIGVELVEGGRPLHEIATGDAVCLVVGHEDRGLSAGALAACGQVAFLPQLGRVCSLNVATAAAIALYEVRRQEWTG